MSKDFGPIGLFDSGLGGLTVLKEIRKALPQEDFVYLGDTARIPYGTKSPATVIGYSKECARFLLEKKAKRIVVACNSASAVALESLQQSFDCPVIGTIDATIRASVSATRNGKIGVLGTSTTVRSGAFERGIKAINPSLEIFSVACPLFVPLVEDGLFSGEIVDGIIKHYLEDLRKAGIDTLILGCTHYPLLKEALANFFGDGTKIVSSSESVAKELYADYLSEGFSNPKQGSLAVYVTDNESGFSRLANHILGAIRPEAVNIVSLD